MKTFTPAGIARACLVVGLLLCIVQAGRQGVAAWYFQTGSPQAIQTAMNWDPGNPEYYDALATLTHQFADSGDVAEIIRFYESATQLSPWVARYWADLGSAYDWAGRPKDAARALHRAQELAPNSPDINWRLANFYIRMRNIPEGLRALRRVLPGETVPRRDVFALAVNATRDNAAILDEMLPASAPILFEYLNFRSASGDMEAAEQVWRHVLELNLPFELNQAFPYLDGLIRNQKLDALGDAWASLAARFPAQIRPRVSPNSSITNGSFEFDALNGGLDWRVVPVPGAAVSVDSREFAEGGRSLRIDFDGTRNLDYGQVFQYVVVKPDTRYRFSGELRAEGITTDSGPRLELFDAYDMGKLFSSTPDLRGTSNWSKRQIDFKTKTDTNLIIVRIARPASRKFANRIAGTVWIDNVALQPEE